MMADHPPIPPAIWARIVAWLKAGGTGRITLDAHQGRVKEAAITERIRESSEAAQHNP